MSTDERATAGHGAPGAAALAWPPWPALAWGYAAAWGIWLVAGGMRPAIVLALLRLPIFAAPAIAALVAGRRRAGRDRWGWWLVALAWAFSLAAGLAWLATGGAGPAADFADDVLYNAYYPLMVAGLLLLSRRPAGAGARLRLGVDAAVVVVASLSIASYVLLRHGGAGERPLEVRDLLSNLVGETLVLLCAAVAVHRPGRGGAEPSLRLLALGAFAATLADLASAGARLADAAALAAGGEALLAVSAALVVSAALRPSGALRSLGLATDLLVRMVAHLPSIAGLAVGGLLLAELVHPAPGSAHQTLLSLALVLLAGLALLRAAIAQRDAELEAAARASQDERVRQGRRMEAMGELAAAVSHDFANILTALGGAAEELRERQPEAPEVEEIAGLVRRGSELCRGLTAFARRSAPQGAADLRQVADALVPLLRRLLPPGVSLAVEGTAGAAPALADPGQIEVALINLVVNARDAMPRGGAVTISVDAVEPAEPGRAGRSGGGDQRRWACLAVTDTGAGMDPDTLARCTEPFFTTKPPGRGTGLGLATVNGIALAAGGRLEITSAPGRGCRVALHLPVAVESGVAAPPGLDVPVAPTTDRR